MKSTIFLMSIVAFSTFTNSAHAGTQPTSPVLTQAQTQAKVREYFKDTPVMIEIARCESNFRQFTDAGNVLRGGDSGGMVGIFQFFESVHAAPAKALGFDITTVEGNLGYAKHVYQNESTTPWNPAKSCWDVVPTTVVKAPATRAELEAKIKQLMQLISLLQELQKLKVKSAR
jgi:hypothetical protein